MFGRGMERRFSGFIPLTIIPLTLLFIAGAEKPSSHSPAHDSLASSAVFYFNLFRFRLAALCQSVFICGLPLFERFEAPILPLELGRTNSYAGRA
jgi:hypothetical protein